MRAVLLILSILIAAAGINPRADAAERRNVRRVDVRLAILVTGLLIELAALLHQASRVWRRGRQRHRNDTGPNGQTV